MPTSPMQQNAAITGSFRRIRNIFQRADESIGPYGWFFYSLKRLLMSRFRRFIKDGVPGP